VILKFVKLQDVVGNWCDLAGQTKTERKQMRRVVIENNEIKKNCNTTLFQKHSE